MDQSLLLDRRSRRREEGPEAKAGMEDGIEVAGCGACSWRSALCFSREEALAGTSRRLPWLEGRKGCNKVRGHLGLQSINAGGQW